MQLLQRSTKCLGTRAEELSESWSNNEETAQGKKGSR